MGLSKKSDIDIAVKYKNFDFTFKGLGGLSFDIQEVFGLENEVDIAVINLADPFFLKKITEHPQLIFGTNRALAELEMYAFKQYIDHKKYLEMEKEFVNEYIASKLKNSA